MDTLCDDKYTFLLISFSSAYNEMFQTEAAEKVKTHILCSITSF
jgi:hypothetical protein